jgi:hypothetical protein
MIVFSCRSEEVKKEEDCKIDSALVSQILKLNKHKVIESLDFELADLQKKYGCSGVDSFLKYKLQDDLLFSKIVKQANDSLNFSLEIEKFKNLILKKENEGDGIIRVKKSTFAFGLNRILLVEVHVKKEDIQLSSFKINFDDSCNTPLLQFPNGKEFTTKCFQLEKTNNKKISQKKWDELKRLMLKTNFNNTTYFEGGGRLICDGSHYSIDYSAGYSLEYGVRHLEKSCPGELTSIHLVAEKLIALSEIRN